jgi:hypothetical protein
MTNSYPTGGCCGDRHSTRWTAGPLSPLRAGAGAAIRRSNSTPPHTSPPIRMSGMVTTIRWSIVWWRGSHEHRSTFADGVWGYARPPAPDLRLGPRLNRISPSQRRQLVLHQSGRLSADLIHRLLSLFHTLEAGNLLVPWRELGDRRFAWNCTLGEVKRRGEP